MKKEAMSYSWRMLPLFYAVHCKGKLAFWITLALFIFLCKVSVEHFFFIEVSGITGK